MLNSTIVINRSIEKGIFGDLMNANMLEAKLGGSCLKSRATRLWRPPTADKFFDVRNVHVDVVFAVGGIPTVIVGEFILNTTIQSFYDLSIDVTMYQVEL